MSELEEHVAKYFPYSVVRQHQDRFITTVFDAVSSSRSVLIEGSNGLGKTIAALSACLPVALDEGFKILYVARTHRQNERVIEELKAVCKRQRVSGVSIRGRREVCLNELVTGHDVDVRSAMEICEMLKARDKCPYFRSIEERTDEFSDVQHQLALYPHTASEIQRMCGRKGFCPHELVKSSLADLNVVALSYLYVFDPVIRGAFLRSLESTLSKVILVIDEAHNLPETAVNIASSKLSLFAIRQAETEAKEFDHGDIADFAKIMRKKIEKTSEGIGREERISPNDLLDFVREEASVDDPQGFFEHLHDTGVSIRRELLLEGKSPRSFIHGLGCFFLKWAETAEDDSYVDLISRYASRTGAPAVRLEIVALDPSKVTAPVFSQVHASVIMSGTLQPLEAYLRITKLPDDTIQNIVPSPFPEENVLPLISLGATTAMEKRTPEMYCKIIERIGEVVKHTPANSGIFTPSFEVLGQLLTEGLKKVLNKPLFCEHRSMTSRENEKMVAEFKKCSQHGGAALLGVQGGRSSEGMDFPGDEMNSVVVVGVPYAEPTPRVKAQIAYFEKCFPGFGREYGYVLPAMKKASQAAGRPIRTPEDRGAIVFLDNRFASDYCRSFLPAWIRDRIRVLPDEKGVLGDEVCGFFKRVC